MITTQDEILFKGHGFGPPKWALDASEHPLCQKCKTGRLTGVSAHLTTFPWLVSHIFCSNRQCDFSLVISIDVRDTRWKDEHFEKKIIDAKSAGEKE